jgi:hypothetical protein
VNGLGITEEQVMDRFNNEQDELIDLGSVTGETKGPPLGDQDDTGFPVKRAIGGGLSND